MRTVPILISIAVLAATTQLAEAKPKGGKGKKPQTKAQQVKAHMKSATAAHKAGNFDVALTELQAAYDLDPKPKLLFAIAQVDAKLDRCNDALDNYEKYLDSKEGKKNKAIVKQAIAACKTKIAEAAPPATPPAEPVTQAIGTTPAPVTTETPPPPPAEPPPPVVTAAPAPAAPIVDEAPPAMGTHPVDGGTHTHKAWYKDAVGDVLLVGGLAAGVGSIVMYTSARHSLDDAEAAPSIDNYVDLVHQAHDQRTYSVILAGASGVLIIGGIVRYAMHSGSESKTVAVTPTSGGGLVTYGGAF